MAYLSIFKEDSYKNIQGYAQKYRDRVQGLKTGVGNRDNPDNDVFAVLMDKGDVARLLLHPDCHMLAAIIGIEENNGDEGITISPLAADRNGHILEEHRIPNKVTNLTLPGEEVWPRKVTIAAMDAFLK